MMEGHTLCIPKREIDYIFDLEDDHYLGLMAFAKRVSAAIKDYIPCNRVAVGVLGLEVPHAHVHLVPVSTEHDFRFGKSIDVSPERMRTIAAELSARLK